MNQITDFIVLDIETYGISHVDRYSGILSIGAVTIRDNVRPNIINDWFSTRTDRHDDAFHVPHISMQSNLAVGLEIDGSTIEWHKNKGNWDKIVANPEMSLPDALDLFVKWVHQRQQLILFAHRYKFDFNLLEAALKRLHIGIPWRYSDVYDSASLFMFNNKVSGGKSSIRNSAAEHTALSDAFHTAMELNALFLHKSLEKEQLPKPNLI